MHGTGPFGARPRLVDGRFAYCALPPGRAVPSSAIGWFREREGVTVILPIEAARAAGLAVAFECAWIALDLESSLEGVGLTAAFSAALAREGIPCNVVAALHHDHIFVPVDRAGEAVAAIERLG